MDQNPEITEDFLDIVSIGCYKLVCYSFGLVLGIPHFVDYKLTFQTNTYLKITEFEFSEYFQFLQVLVDYLYLNVQDRIKLQQKYQQKYLQDHIIVSHNPDNPYIEQTNDYVCYCRISENAQSGNFKLILNINLPEKLSFNLDECQIYNFICGFETLFFKVYCYNVDIYRSVRIFVNQFHEGEIYHLVDNNTSSQDIYHLLVSTTNPTLRVILSEVIYRHKKDLYLWKKLIPYTNTKVSID